MAQAGFHAAIGYQARRIIPYEERLFPALIFGAMLPDLDIIIVAIGSIMYPIAKSQMLFHRTFTHSIFIPIFIYLLFAIFSELKKQSVFKSIGKGLALGILTHHLIDILIWFSQIDLFWPLPLDPINLWKTFVIPIWIFHVLLVLEFLFFRWYAWFLICRHMECPGKYSRVITHLVIWKKIESILICAFIIIVIWNPPFLKFLFGLAYIPSLLMALYSTYTSRDTLEFNAI